MSNKAKYPPEVRREVIRLHLEEGRTCQSLCDEYNIPKSTITYWLKQYREECISDKYIKEESESYAENLKLRRENAELKKEIEFLKKAAAFFAKELQ